MKEMRIRLQSGLMSKHVQEALFELGCEWHSGDTEPLYLDDENRADYIMVNENKKMSNAETEYVRNAEYDNYTERDLMYLHRLLVREPKIERDNWYRIKRTDGAYGHDAVVYYKGGAEGMYGWNYRGEWTSGFSYGKDLKDINPERIVSKASDEDVIERFRSEMKKRGFTDYCRFKDNDISIQTLDNLSKTMFYEDYKTKVKCGDGNGLIFNNGKWAEVHKGGLPMIAGYKGEWDSVNKEVIYGCKRFTSDFVLSDGFAQMDSMMVEGNQVKASEMRDVYEFVKANV